MSTEKILMKFLETRGKTAWKDDVDSWPNLTHTRRDVSSKNPHTEDQLMN